MAGKINGFALGAIGAGGLFLYAGITGKDIPAAIRAIVSGKSPATAPVKNPITGITAIPDNPSGGTATGQQIAVDALAYQGHPYCYGGSQAASTGGCPAGQWDCSSFVNWVIGHDLGLAIPGYPPGAYDGTTHGPNTLMWLAWNGVTHIPRSEAGAGDIFCWQTHMGIATSNDSMISAQTPQSGTEVATGNISSFIPGEILFVLRLKATLGPGPGGGKK